MKVTMKSDLDLVYLKKKLKKNVHKRTSTVPTPFMQDLSGTGQILSLKAIGIGEAGALSLAAELTRGACPMLETLNLNGCQVRSDGIGRIFQGIKTANLLSIRTLQLKGNFIRAAGLEYMQEIFPSGVFMNLAVLDLGDNELRDDGAGVLVNIILQGFLMSIVDINLQHNSITDQGFFKIVSVMKSLKDTKCPLMERLRMENNLVTALTRRRNAPYPPFFSF
jgi:Ran GTPase-activating protein (RanGAP) involved in mRNA processing and transport